MEELERLRKKVKNARELQSIVKIMKNISAANIREYGQAVESLASYEKTIEMGLQILLRDRPQKMLTAEISKEPVKRKYGIQLGAIIFGSDQGLIGKFNEQIAAFALAKMNELGGEKSATIAVGERVVARLEEAGQTIDEHFSFSGNILGITQVMLNVLLEIEQWRMGRGIEQIVLFYNRPAREASFDPHMVYLYPLDMRWLVSLAEKKWPSRSLPTFSMDADQLFASLIRQHFFASLYRAFVESLASENASRLLSMQMAEKNIEDHLNELTIQFQRQRQAAITSELLDVITGFEAMTGKKSE